jgi:hypothetical protein
MRYEDPTVEIFDLDILAAPHGALIAFLKQFYDINTRWGIWYEPVTLGIIEQCAEIQKDIVLKHRRSRKALSEDSLLIALAFRALAFVHNVGEVCVNLPYFSNGEFSSSFLEPTKIRNEANPSIEVSTCEIDGGFSSIQEADGRKLTLMIQDIVRITQRLLLRQKPADSPVLFCTICLLKLIQGQFFSELDFLNIFPGEKVFEKVWRRLCQLYDVFTNGRHPLVDHWRSGEYESLVGHDVLAARHMNSLNDMWVDGGI